MTPTSTRSSLAWAAVAVVTAVTAAWFGWLVWDVEVEVVEGLETWQLESWRVSGVGTSLVAILVVAQLALRRHPDPSAVAVVTSRSLTWTFCLWMYAYLARQDDSGLFLMGLTLIYAATAVGCIVVSHALARITRRPIYRLPI